MNNFEKRLFLDYLYSLINEYDLKSYSFGEVFDFFCDEFRVSKKEFKIDEYGELLLDNVVLRNEFKRRLKTIIKQLQERMPKKNTILEHQLLLLKDIFKLDEDEYGVFTYCVIQEVNNIFKGLFESIDRDPFAKFAQVYLKIRYNRRTRVTESLYLKNLTDSRRGNDINVNPEILTIFDNPNCKTITQLVHMLLGKSEKSNLTLNELKL